MEQELAEVGVSVGRQGNSMIQEGTWGCKMLWAALLFFLSVVKLGLNAGIVGLGAQHGASQYQVPKALGGGRGEIGRAHV